MRCHSLYWRYLVRFFLIIFYFRFVVVIQFDVVKGCQKSHWAEEAEKQPSQDW